MSEGGTRTWEMTLDVAVVEQDGSVRRDGGDGNRHDGANGSIGSVRKGESRVKRSSRDGYGDC